MSKNAQCDCSSPTGPWGVWPPLAVNIDRLHEHAPWGRSTSYKLVSSGELAAKKLGRSTIVLWTDLVAFLDGLEAVNGHA